LEQDQLDEACANGSTRVPTGLTPKSCSGGRLKPPPPPRPPPPPPSPRPRYLVATD